MPAAYPINGADGRGTAGYGTHCEGTARCAGACLTQQPFEKGSGQFRGDGGQDGSHQLVEQHGDPPPIRKRIPPARLHFHLTRICVRCMSKRRVELATNLDTDQTREYAQRTGPPLCRPRRTVGLLVGLGGRRRFRHLADHGFAQAQVEVDADAVAASARRVAMTPLSHAAEGRDRHAVDAGLLPPASQHADPPGRAGTERRWPPPGPGSTACLRRPRFCRHTPPKRKRK